MQSIGCRTSRGLLPYEIIDYVDNQLAQARYATECSPSYITIVRDFIMEHIVHKLADTRRRRGMFDALDKSDEWDADTDLSMGATGESVCPRIVQI